MHGSCGMDRKYPDFRESVRILYEGREAAKTANALEAVAIFDSRIWSALGRWAAAQPIIRSIPIPM